jgi:3-hydroxyisobutyrate dehydrogenase
VFDMRRAASHISRPDARGPARAKRKAEEPKVVFTSPRTEGGRGGGEETLAGMRKGSAWFDLSTNSPTVVRRLSERFAAQGIAMLDAPVSGGPAGAKSRKLALWVGGDRAVYNQHKTLIDAIGDEPMYIGPIGAGSVAKLMHNMSGYAVMAALAECFSVGVKAGIDPLLLWTAVRQGAMGRKRVFDRLSEQFLPDKYEPAAFALKLGVKDAMLATELGRELNVPMRIANLTYSDMIDALNRGWADRDTRAFMLLQSERGVRMAVPDEAEGILIAASAEKRMTMTRDP